MPPVVVVAVAERTDAAGEDDGAAAAAVDGGGDVRTAEPLRPRPSSGVDGFGIGIDVAAAGDDAVTVVM